jgi:putative aldouronate transport system permease protein
MVQSIPKALSVKSARSARSKKGGWVFGDILRNPFSYLLLLPAVLYTFIFGYATLPYIIIAFEKYNFQTGLLSPWVGLQNFKFFFSTDKWWIVTRNTIRLNFLFIIAGTAFALILSVLINEMRNRRYAKTVQTIYLFPSFVSWVTVSFMVYALFATQFGMINNVLSSLGLATSNKNWYAEPGAWIWILVVMNLWKGMGYNTVIYLAAITGIDGELFEAAMIDGANRFQRIRYITVPLLLPMMAILTLMSVGRIFYGDFGMIYAIIGDASLLYPTTDVIDTYVFRALRRTGDPSIAMAVGLYQSVIGFILVFGVNAITRKFFPEGALF